jgi:hypothetical protein
VERTDAGMLSEYFTGPFADWMALDHDGIRHGDATCYNYLVNTLIQVAPVPVSDSLLMERSGAAFLPPNRSCSRPATTACSS